MTRGDKREERQRNNFIDQADIVWCTFYLLPSTFCLQIYIGLSPKDSPVLTCMSCMYAYVQYVCMYECMLYVMYVCCMNVRIYMNRMYAYNICI